MKTILLLSTFCFALFSFGQTGIISAKSKGLDATLSTVKNDNFGLPEPQLDSIIYIGNHCIIQVMRTFSHSDSYHDTVCDPYIFENNNYDMNIIKEMYSSNVVFVGFEKLKTEKTNRRRTNQNSFGWIALLLFGGVIISRKKIKKKLPLAITISLLGFGSQLNAQTGVIALKSQGRDVITLNKLDDTFGGPAIRHLSPISKVINIRYLGNCSIEMTRQIKSALVSENEACTSTLSIDTIVGITTMHADDFTLESFKKNFDEGVVFEGFEELKKERKKIAKKSKKNTKESGINGWFLIIAGISSFFLLLKKRSVIA